MRWNGMRRHYVVLLAVQVAAPAMAVVWLVVARQLTAAGYRWLCGEWLRGAAPLELIPRPTADLYEESGYQTVILPLSGEHGHLCISK
jgi:hypothetical protein